MPSPSSSPASPDSHTLRLVLILGLLSAIGPFAIDMYLPALPQIGSSLGAQVGAVQASLTAFFLSLGVGQLLYGPVSDMVGRKPPLYFGLTVFALASVGCAMATSIETLVVLRFIQGLGAAAGMAVPRAVVRDLFPPAQAQRVMAQITIFFGIAPALAPVLGGWLFVHLGWAAVFWFLTLVGVLLWSINWRFLPESLPQAQRQPFRFKPLMQGYKALCSDPRFVLLAFASGVPFNGMFLYVLSAPAFLGDLLHLQPQQFFWFFVISISGIMGGAWVSGRLAGRIPPKHQIRHGFLIMFVVSIVNLVANLIWPAHVSWALIPVGVFAFGWAMMVPVVTLLVLDIHPERRGLASSLQAVVGSTANGIVAGVLAPLVMHSTVLLALGSISMMLIGLASWIYLHHRWPEIGRHASEA